MGLSNRVLAVVIAVLLTEVAKSPYLTAADIHDSVQQRIKRTTIVSNERYMEIAAKMFKVDAGLLKAIIAHESLNNPNAINKHTQDYGLGQLNYSTFTHYGITKSEVFDPALNIFVAAKQLAFFKRNYAKSEPSTWYCRYNWGTRPLDGFEHICERYITKVGYRVE